MNDFKQIPLRSVYQWTDTTPLESVADIKQIDTAYGGRPLPTAAQVRCLRDAEEGEISAGRTRAVQHVLASLPPPASGRGFW